MSFGQLESVRRVFDQKGFLRKSEPLVAIDDATLTFEQGELISFLGPSGCGKTTLLRIIAGLIPKTSGTLQIGGRDISEPLGGYGFVFQSPSLMHWRSVLPNPLVSVGIPRRRLAAPQHPP